MSNSSNLCPVCGAPEPPIVDMKQIYAHSDELFQKQDLMGLKFIGHGWKCKFCDTFVVKEIKAS